MATQFVTHAKDSTVCEYNSSTRLWESTGVSKDTYLQPYVTDLLDHLSDRFLITYDVEGELLRSLPDLLNVVPTDNDCGLIPCLDGKVIEVRYPLVFRDRTEEDYCSFEYQARFDSKLANRNLGLILFGSKYKKSIKMLLCTFIEYHEEIIFRGSHANELQEIIEPIFRDTILVTKFKFKPKAKRAKNTISAVSVPKDLDQCRFFSWLCDESQYFYEKDTDLESNSDDTQEGDS